MANVTKLARVEKQPVAQIDLDEINRHTLRELSAEEVFTFRLAACDNQFDRDEERFSDRTLEELKQLYPGKPVLLDHNWSAKEQVARIYGASVQADSAREGVKRLMLRCFVPRLNTTKAFIDAIETGLKKECSVGCAVENSLCTICQQDYYGGNCIHQKGREYDGVVCRVVLDGAADAYEVSMVAVPAQKEAGVVKSHEPGADRAWVKAAKLALAVENVRFGALRR